MSPSTTGSRDDLPGRADTTVMRHRSRSYQVTPARSGHPNRKRGPAGRPSTSRVQGTQPTAPVSRSVKRTTQTPKTSSPRPPDPHHHPHCVEMCPTQGVCMPSDVDETLESAGALVHIARGCPPPGCPDGESGREGAQRPPGAVHPPRLCSGRLVAERVGHLDTAAIAPIRCAWPAYSMSAGARRHRFLPARAPGRCFVRAPKGATGHPIPPRSCGCPVAQPGARTTNPVVGKVSEPVP